MDFFNVGGGEILVLALLALLLFGPEELIRMARTLREYAQKARRAWLQLTTDLERDVLTDEIKATIQETKSSVAEVQHGLKAISTLEEDDLAEDAPPDSASEPTPTLPGP